MNRKAKLHVPILLLAVVALLFFGGEQTKADTTARSGDRLATISASISTGATVIAAATNRAIRVESMIVRSDTAGVVAFKDGAAGTTLANIYMAANTTYTFGPDYFGDSFVLTSGNLLQATLSSATLTITVRYRLE